ncbi:MAG: hypothetical protein H7645_11900 [Candidatus Heimdallarchaeota archaeon]|nr:hypothetical protein [Candidatus Heimdallarchaeota archaeon]MCK4771026.1 hypothetical protein [Candidatus Heimdallarchaeota archaeon]
MFRELLGRRIIDRKIEKNLVEMSLIPSKYFEALYIERRTEIASPVFDLLEEEEKAKRGELIELLKEGIVDTKIEIVKFELYERLVAVTSSMKEVRVSITENKLRVEEEEYKELVNILKDVSKLGKIMYEMVRGLYQEYDIVEGKMENLRNMSKKITAHITKFRFHMDEEAEKFDFEDSNVLISNSIRESIQSMVDVGEKITGIIDEFDFNR